MATDHKKDKSKMIKKALKKPGPLSMPISTGDSWALQDILDYLPYQVIMAENGILTYLTIKLFDQEHVKKSYEKINQDFRLANMPPSIGPDGTPIDPPPVPDPLLRAAPEMHALTHVILDVFQGIKNETEKRLFGDLTDLKIKVIDSMGSRGRGEKTLPDGSKASVSPSFPELKPKKSKIEKFINNLEKHSANAIIAAGFKAEFGKGPKGEPLKNFLSKYKYFGQPKESFKPMEEIFDSILSPLLVGFFMMVPPPLPMPIKIGSLKLLSNPGTIAVITALFTAKFDPANKDIKKLAKKKMKAAGKGDLEWTEADDAHLEAIIKSKKDNAKAISDGYKKFLPLIEADIDALLVAPIDQGGQKIMSLSAPTPAPPRPTSKLGGKTAGAPILQWAASHTFPGEIRVAGVPFTILPPPSGGAAKEDTAPKPPKIKVISKSGQISSGEIQKINKPAKKS